MEIILKSLITLLIIGFIYTTYFIISEYGKFYKSPEAEEGSTFEKFIISLLAFSGVAFFVAVTLFCGLLMFCGITINLPF